MMVIHLTLAIQRSSLQGIPVVLAKQPQPVLPREHDISLTDIATESSKILVLPQGQSHVWFTANCTTGLVWGNKVRPKAFCKGILGEVLSWPYFFSTGSFFMGPKYVRGDMLGSSGRGARPQYVHPKGTEKNFWNFRKYLLLGNTNFSVPHVCTSWLSHRRFETFEYVSKIVSEAIFDMWLH